MRYAVLLTVLLLTGCAAAIVSPVDMPQSRKAPLPRTIHLQNDKVVDKVITESYINNHRLLFSCSGVENVSVKADASGLTLVFPPGTHFSEQAATAVESLKIPCTYAGYTGNGSVIVKFVCLPETMVYPEFSEGALDLILTSGG